jgi:hypothetical protein
MTDADTHPDRTRRLKNATAGSETTVPEVTASDARLAALQQAVGNQPVHRQVRGATLSPLLIVGLQRSIGNRAVQRLLRGSAIHAKLTVDKPNDTGEHQIDRAAPGQAMQSARTSATLVQRKSESGLAEEAPTSALASRAFEFWAAKENKGKPLTALVERLMILVGESLKTLPGAPPLPKLTFKKGVGYSGFVKKAWELVVDTSMLSYRVGATTVGQLDGAEVGEIADTIWHESRHSEQFFRIARMRADKMRAASTTDVGAGEPTPDDIAAKLENELEIPDWVAALAAHAPRLTDETERQEAEGWYEFTFGKYLAYRLEVDWLKDLAWELNFFMVRRMPTTWTKSGAVIADMLRTVSMAAYKDYEDEVDAYAVGGAAKAQTMGLFKQARVPESNLPLRVTSERKPERNNIRAILDALAKSLNTFPDIKRIILEKQPNPFDESVVAYIDKILECKGQFEKFQLSAVKRTSLVEVDANAKGSYAEYEEVFSDIREEIQSLIALLGGVDPERGRVGEIVAEIEKDVKALSKGRKDNVLDSYIMEITKKSNDLEMRAYEALTGWPAVGGDSSDDGDSSEESESDQAQPIDAASVPALLLAATDLDLAVVTARLGLLQERRRQRTQEKKTS